MLLGLRQRFAILVAALVAGPALPLGYLAFNGLTKEKRAGQLGSDVTQMADQVQQKSTELQRLSDQNEKCEAATRDVLRSDFLDHRDSRQVFDSLAQALAGTGIVLETMNLLETGTLKGDAQRDGISTERIDAVCTGDYEGITACLTRLSASPLPQRMTSVELQRDGGKLRLKLRTEVPFVAAETAGPEDKTGTHQ